MQKRREGNRKRTGWLCLGSFVLTQLIQCRSVARYATCCMQTYSVVSHPSPGTTCTGADASNTFFTIPTPPLPVPSHIKGARSTTNINCPTQNSTLKIPITSPISFNMFTLSSQMYCPKISLCSIPKASCPTFSTYIHTYGSIQLIVSCCRNESYSTAPR